MGREAFDELVDAVSGHLEKDVVTSGPYNSVFQSKRSCGDVGLISTTLKVSMTLRWLAGGSYLDIAAHHGVSHTSFYRFRDAVLEAILLSDAVGLPTLVWSFRSLSAIDSNSWLSFASSESA